MLSQGGCPGLMDLGLSLMNMAIACAVLSLIRDLLCLRAGLSAVLPAAQLVWTSSWRGEHLVLFMLKLFLSNFFSKMQMH